MRLVLIEDHQALREGLELLLDREGCQVVGTAGTADEGRRLVEDLSPDVALVDIRLGSDSALGVVEETLARDQAAAIVLHTGFTGTGDLKKAARVGARGFVLKSSGTDALVAALRCVAGGGHYVDPGLAPLLVDRAAGSAATALSPREREIFGLLADGLNGQAIAELLFLSPETVRTHVRNGTAKLGAKTRVQAVALLLGRAA